MKPGPYQEALPTTDRIVVKPDGDGSGVAIGEGWHIENCNFSDNFHDPKFGWGENGRRGGIVLDDKFDIIQLCPEFPGQAVERLAHDRLELGSSHAVVLPKPGGGTRRLRRFAA